MVHLKKTTIKLHSHEMGYGLIRDMPRRKLWKMLLRVPLEIKLGPTSGGSQEMGTVEVIKNIFSRP